MLSYYEFVLKVIFWKYMLDKYGDPDKVPREKYMEEKQKIFGQDYTHEYEAYLRSLEIPKHPWGS